MDGSTPAFSPQQVQAIDAVGAWLKDEDRQPIFRLFGYAGTGKTTIAKYLAEDLKNVVYMAFTGKAALMMRRNGCHGAATIHSTIYTPVEKGDGSFEFIWDSDGACASADLIVIDECSMVDKDLAMDILRYKKPILVLGDPAQLPPVKGAGYFTEVTPDAMLTEIHRQAGDNPIIRLATDVRQGNLWFRDEIPLNDDPRVQIVKRGTLSGEEILAADQVLVGKNVTRHAYNKKIRNLLGRTGWTPQKDDRLVCLRNDKGCGIFNGGIFETVEQLHAKRATKKIRLKVRSVDQPKRAPFIVSVRREFFFGGVEDLDWRDLKNSQQFDYGYALTCHKAQGSQWGHVIAYDESSIFRDDAHRWLYTAITRAEEKITLVI